MKFVPKCFLRKQINRKSISYKFCELYKYIDTCRNILNNIYLVKEENIYRKIIHTSYIYSYILQISIFLILLIIVSFRKSNEFNLESLCKDVMMVKKTAEKSGVQEIDFILLTQFCTALENKTTSELRQVLINTIGRLQDALSHVHKNFKQYILEPCPKTLDMNKKRKEL